MKLTTLIILLPFFTPALAARNPFHFKRQSVDPSASATGSASSDAPSQGTPTSTSSAASFSPSTIGQGIPCTTIADCPTGSFCNQFGHGVNGCLAFNDCRAGGCPGGDCVPGNPARTDPTDPDAGFICSFPNNGGSSSASSAPSSAGSTSVVSTSSAPSSIGHPSSMMPSQSMSSSPAPSSLPTGNAGDCRTTGCSHHESCVPSFSGTTPSYGCVDCASPDCRSTGCAAESFCSFYSPNNKTMDYVCLMNSSFPATTDCRQMGCPGGVCGYNGIFFQCFFGDDAMTGRYCPEDGSSSSSSSSSMAMSSMTSSMMSSMASSMMPSMASGHPSMSVPSGTGAPHPPSSSAPAPTSDMPAPQPTSHPAPVSATSTGGMPPADTSKAHPTPMSAMPIPSAMSMMPAPVPEASKAPAQGGGSGGGSGSGSGAGPGCDLGGIYDLLWQIKADLYTVKCDVDAIKAKLEL